MNSKRKYIIYTIRYNEKNGGVIALHRLCHMLNEEGEKAYIWPAHEFPSNKKKFYKKIKSFIKKVLYKLSIKKFTTNPDFNTPIANKNDLKDAIVVYPESVSGNPLQSNNIVRWLLFKPGGHTGEIRYGSNELYFYFSPQFNDKTLSSLDAQQLKTIYIRDDVYFQSNFSERTGSCYILRKGKDKEIVHDLSDSILVDEMSHEEMAKVFNKVKYCISYDGFTVLSRFAAMCGCISVVIPEKGVTKEVWRPNEEERYGLAYGFDDIQWAIDTQKLISQNNEQQNSRSKEQVRQFIKTTQSFFANI